MPQCRGHRRFRISRPAPWTVSEYVYSPAGQMLPVRWSQPYGQVRFLSMFGRHVVFIVSRDCLAAPGTTIDSGVGNPNKNKTCYKCQQEGHVRCHASPPNTRFSLLYPDCKRLPRDPGSSRLRVSPCATPHLKASDAFAWQWIRFHLDDFSAVIFIDAACTRVRK
jgi:hypothetical protein